MAVTLADVAKLAGTSSAAASVALNGMAGKSTRLSKETRERIYAAAAELGYVSNPIAKSLATGKTGVLGLMLPYQDAFIDHNPFTSTLIAGILHEVFARSYNIMLYAATSTVTAESMPSMVDSRVDGVLIVMPPQESDLFRKCEQHRIPAVSVLRDPVGDAYCVNADDYAGGKLATAHLIGLGHQRIAHLVGDPSVNTTKHRLRGYRDALREAGLPHDPKLEIDAGFNNRPGFEATLRLLENNHNDLPTAIFACNDLCAAGAVLALKQAGLSVPGDVAVVGYDDTPFCESVQPSLSSVRMPIEEMGKVASRILMSLVEKADVADPRPMLPVSLTIRQSCGAPRATDNPGTTAPMGPLQ